MRGETSKKGMATDIKKEGEQTGLVGNEPTTRVYPRFMYLLGSHARIVA